MKIWIERQPRSTPRDAGPTLHAYGENDPRVKIKNWTELEGQLRKYNKPYEYVREDNQGHGFMDEKARTNFYRTLEAFLAKYMAPSAIFGTPMTGTLPKERAS